MASLGDPLLGSAADGGSSQEYSVCGRRPVWLRGALVSVLLLGGVALLVALAVASVAAGSARVPVSGLMGAAGHEISMASPGHAVAVFAFWVFVVGVGIVSCLMTIVCAGLGGIGILGLGDQLRHFRFLPSNPTRQLEHNDFFRGRVMNGRITSECIFDVFMVVFGVFLASGAAATADWRRIPAWIWAVVLLVALRSKLMEANIYASHFKTTFHQQSNILRTMLHLVRRGHLPWFDFLSGLPDCVDGLSHGVAIVNAYVLDPVIHPFVMEAWSHGTASAFRPLIDSLHLWGIMAITVFVSSIWQLGTVMFISSFSDQNGMSTAARICGHVSLGVRIDECDPTDSFLTRLLLNITKTWGEALPNLLWQTSLAMALCMQSCEGLLAGDKTLAVNLCLSAVMALKSGCSLIAEVFKNPKDLRDCFRGPAIAVVIPLVIGMSLFMLTRFAMIEICPSHAWGLSSGCVPVSAHCAGHR